jgi:uncharacterized protein (DUF2236 family)
MLVSESAFERSLESACRGADPRGGVFGPGSALWEIQQHAWIFLGAGRAALLQLAHPGVAHAIAQHSDARRHPWRRFQRTFAQVFAMVFGDLAQARSAARRVHRVHARIGGVLRDDEGALPRGTHYSAADLDALIWVHATLWDTSLRVHEAVLGPLPPQLGERYHRDTQRFAGLFGIPVGALPPDPCGFERYCAQMFGSDRLHVGATAREIARSLLQALPLAWTPLGPLHALLTAHLLPPAIRSAYELPWSAPRERIARATLSCVRGLHAHGPRVLRELPAHRVARLRVHGQEPGPLDAWLERLLTGRGALRG